MISIEDIIKDLELSAKVDHREDPDTPIHEFTSYRAARAINQLVCENERLKSGDVILINGRVINRPISFHEWLEISDEKDYDPDNQELMWYVDLKRDDVVSSSIEPDMHFFDRGLVHRNKEDAIKHTRALLSFTDFGGSKNG